MKALDGGWDVGIDLFGCARAENKRKGVAVAANKEDGAILVLGNRNHQIPRHVIEELLAEHDRQARAL